eukprot:Skav200293  [mRNA]  locus=scaffold2127:417264:424453:+ [translate_table: standard]
MIHHWLHHKIIAPYRSTHHPSRLRAASQANFLVAPKPQKDASWVAVYVPQASMVARVSLYHLSKPSKIVMELNLPNKVKDCQMLWNFDGTALLANAMSDVDETGNSYFGRKLEKSLGNSKRNTLKWNPFGRFAAVAGFGTLPGDLDFYEARQLTGIRGGEGWLAVKPGG